MSLSYLFVLVVVGMFLYIRVMEGFFISMLRIVFFFFYLCLVVGFWGVPAAVHKVPDLCLLVSFCLCAYAFVLFICGSRSWNIPVYQSHGGVLDLAVADCLFLLLFSLSGGRVLGGCLPSCTRFPILAGVTLKETTNFNKPQVHVKTLRFCS